MKRWEYQTFEKQLSEFRDYNTLNEAFIPWFNELGADGWNIVRWDIGPGSVMVFVKRKHKVARR